MAARQLGGPWPPGLLGEAAEGKAKPTVGGVCRADEGAIDMQVISVEAATDCIGPVVSFVACIIQQAVINAAGPGDIKWSIKEPFIAALWQTPAGKAVVVKIV